MKKKHIIVTLICLIISLVSGILSHDILIGGITLFTSLLCSYFASEGKRINYILGCIFNLTYAYASYKNGLYGLSIFYLFVFTSINIYGFLTWSKNLNQEKEVKVRGFNLKNSILIIVNCIIGSLLLGYLLTLIPGEQLSYMDATSNIVNLCATILLALRFKECWWLWLVNNIVDLIIWSIVLINHGDNAIMMFLVALGFLLLNIYGIIKWYKEK